MGTRQKHGRMAAAYAFVLPAAVFMLVMIGYPVLYNIVISFRDVTAFTIADADTEFVGLENYKELFADPSFINAFRQTFIFTLRSLVLQFGIGFMLAVFLCKGFPCLKTVRSLIVISWILPITVTALMWKFMLSENGIINYLLMSIGITDSPVYWLIERDTALWGINIANAWVGIPFNVLLITTGLNNIPSEIYDATSIDGANAFQRFFFVTVPMLKSTLLSVLVLGFVYTFKVFDLIFVMTGGGPVDATEVLSTYSYKQSFSFYDFSGGAAAANVLAVILLTVALIYMRTVQKED